jgi:hypothetical protein
MRPVLLPVASTSNKRNYRRPISGSQKRRDRFRERARPLIGSQGAVPMQENECREIALSVIGRKKVFGDRASFNIIEK